MQAQLTQLCLTRHQWPILRRGSVDLSALNDDVLVAARAWVVYNRTDRLLDRAALASLLPESAQEIVLLGERSVILYVA